MNRSPHLIAALLTALFLVVGVVGWQLGRRVPAEGSSPQIRRSAESFPSQARSFHERHREDDDD
jgi:hypothetical protein